jgi:putative glutamine amidotransferase
MKSLSPMVGLTARRELVGARPADVVDAEYSEAIISAGGLPFLLPEGPADEMLKYLDCLDGLVLTGGGDVDPGSYGMAASPLVGGVDRTRDVAETALVQDALTRRIPVLGICRGCQLMNVAMGGTLIQHLPDVSDLSHLVPDSRESGEHNVRLEPGSRLAAVLGAKDLMVNSVHHQAVKDLAPGVRATAWATDGVVEAIELDDAPWIGVQWHPENLQRSGRHRALFTWLVTAARGRHGLERKATAPGTAPISMGDRTNLRPARWGSGR